MSIVCNLCRGPSPNTVQVPSQVDQASQTLTTTELNLHSLCLLLLQVFEKIPSLLYLYAQGNQLKEIPSGLPVSLEQLRLGRNRISKIPAGAFNKMGNLTLLDLYNNQVNITLT